MRRTWSSRTASVPDIPGVLSGHRNSPYISVARCFAASLGLRSPGIPVRGIKWHARRRLRRCRRGDRSARPAPASDDNQSGRARAIADPGLPRPCLSTLARNNQERGDRTAPDRSGEPGAGGRRNRAYTGLRDRSCRQWCGQSARSPRRARHLHSIRTGGPYQQRQIAFADLVKLFGTALVADLVLLLAIYRRFWLPIMMIGCALLSRRSHTLTDTHACQFRLLVEHLMLQRSQNVED